MGEWGGRRAQELLAVVIAEYGTICHLCGSDGADSVDHLDPRSTGGDDSIERLRPAHLGCNSARQAMPLDQWFARHPLPVDRAAPSLDWTSSTNQ